MGGEVRGDDIAGSLVEEVVEENGEGGGVLGGEGFRFPAVFCGVDAFVGIVEVLLVAILAERGIFRNRGKVPEKGERECEES